MATPQTAVDLTKAISGVANTTLTDTPVTAEEENLPITGVTWGEAFLFCYWDGGRLPTEAEWEYAASGGPKNTLFPWGQAAANPALAHFAPGAGGKAHPVGSLSAGAGVFGQLDLSGNVGEWTYDGYDGYDGGVYSKGQCVDCAVRAKGYINRAVRGGNFEKGWPLTRAAARNALGAKNGYARVGSRCARDVPANLLHRFPLAGARGHLLG